MWGFQQGFQWWMPVFGMGMMLFWVVVVGLAVWGLSRFVGSRNVGTGAGEIPADILRTRLARGEITTEQFEALQDSLQGSIRNA